MLYFFYIVIIERINLGLFCKYLINEKIKDEKVLVIDDDGKNLGVMQTKEAINLANNRDLDLVLFVPASKTKKVAICKIIKYDKFAYQQQIKLKESKKKQMVIVSKEVKVKPQIGKNDLQWKANQSNKWLQLGYQIKFKVMTFGRIATKIELIEQVYNDFFKLIESNAKIFSKLTKVSPIMYEAIFVKK